jgi:hypothetical protein
VQVWVFATEVYVRTGSICGNGPFAKAQARCGCIHGGRVGIDKDLLRKARICTVSDRDRRPAKIYRCQARVRESLSAWRPTQRTHGPRKGCRIAAARLSATPGKPLPDVGVSSIFIKIKRNRLRHVYRHAPEKNLHATIFSPSLPLSLSFTLPLSHSF